LRFPGQYFDAETGNHYNYFRDYDPSTGRYIQGDPTGLAGGLNLYAYVGTNPLSLVDPFGQAGQCANQPSFSPGYWNDGGRVQNTNNCYSYAWDRPENPLPQRPRPFPDKPQPGGFTGRPFEKLTCSSIIAASIRDGMSKPSAAGACPSCSHKVFLVIAPDTDYHWYRQDGDGTWSHKPGWSNATNLDASGNPITNPETANRNYGGGLNYSTKCGYLCAPNR
jgi:RHS repeat-associated protein